MFYHNMIADRKVSTAYTGGGLYERRGRETAPGEAARCVLEEEEQPYTSPPAATSNVLNEVVAGTRGLTPLYHLEGRATVKYLEDELLPVHRLDLFQVALELFNRHNVRNINNVPGKVSKVRGRVRGKTVTGGENGEMSSCFYECSGKMKVTLKLCSRCRDVEKQRGRFDYYYIDLVEISQTRTVQCSTCMYHFLRKHVQGQDFELREELQYLRNKQKRGILVDPFLISCGK